MMLGISSTLFFVTLLLWVIIVREVDAFNQGDKVWTTKHEWLLQDAVPRYTIANGKHTATLWAQLQQETPEFQSFTLEQLEKRQRALEKLSRTSFKSGPSAEVLNNWFVENNTILRGTVSGCSGSIWMIIHRGGNLGLGASSSNPELYSAGGYIEASDHKIYELGNAAVNRQTTIVQEDQLQIKLEHAAKETRKSILLAITLSSVLSGILAFNIGEQMASYSQSIAHSKTTQVIIIKKPSSLEPCTRTLEERSFTQSRTISNPEISISEQRARQELRVLREKRANENLQDRIQQDEQKLSELQREETRLEGFF